MAAGYCWDTAKMLSSSIAVSAKVLNRPSRHELVKFVGRGKSNRLACLAGCVYLGAAGRRRSWRHRAWRERALVAS
jgi:hypothetical protein